MGAMIAHAIVKHFDNPFLEWMFPVMYATYGCYIFYSPVSISCHLMITGYLNTLSTLISGYHTNFLVVSIISGVDGSKRAKVRVANVTVTKVIRPQKVGVGTVSFGSLGKSVWW